MKSTVEHLNPTRVKLTVEVPFDELKPHFDKAYGALAGQVRIPGFRPGTPTPARPDGTQFVTSIQNFGGDFGLAAHHQRAERRNQLDEFALVQAGFDRDLQRVLAREFVHSALRNGIGDEDLRRSHRQSCGSGY